MGTLIEQVRRKLNITWDDADTTARVEEIIASATLDLEHKLGVADFDFSQAGMENLLFMNHCLYEWNHALEDFDLNYARMIAQVRAKHEVKAYLAEVDNEKA